MCVQRCVQSSLSLSLSISNCSNFLSLMRNKVHIFCFEILIIKVIDDDDDGVFSELIFF